MKTFWPDKLNFFSERKLLGAGQYGLVYRVFNPKRQQITVIKLVEVVDDLKPEVVKRFKREIKGMEKVESPFVVKMLDYSIHPRFLAFEMEYVPGLTLERFIQKTRPFPYQKYLKLFEDLVVQICTGLEAIHQHNLIHRDIKPSNILLRVEGLDPEWPDSRLLAFLESNPFEVKITDLGVLKDLTASVSITRTSDFIGTASYVSPEQAQGRKITPAADMYSLGVLCYELLCGKNPFQRKNIVQTINAHLHEEAASLDSILPNFPVELAQLFSALLKKDPVQRYYTPTSMKRILLQRRERSQQGKIDLEAYLLPTAGSNRCPGWNHFREVITQTANNSNCVYLKLKSSAEIAHFIGHSQRSESPVYFFSGSRVHEGFIGTFVTGLLKPFSRDQFNEFLALTPPDSLTRLLLKFTDLQDLRLQLQFLHKKLRFIPHQLLLYNWIQLSVELLRYIARKNVPVVVFHSVDQILPAYGYFLAPVIQLTSGIVNWVFTETDNRPDLEKLLPCPITRMNAGDFFFENMDCPLANSVHPVENELGELNPGESLDPEELKLLRLITTSGNPISLEFTNWVLQEKLQGKIEYALSLLQKQVLQYSPGPNGGEIFVTRPELAEIHLSENYDRELKSISDYWSGRNDLQSREKYFQLLYRQNQFNKAVRELEDLLGYYTCTCDLPRQWKLHSIFRRINKCQKLPTVTVLNFRLAFFRLQLINGEYEKVYEKAQHLLAGIAGKYVVEKIRLQTALVTAALLLKKTDEAAKWLAELKTTDSEKKRLLTQLLFLKAVAADLQGETGQAEKLTSETLMTMNQRGWYWNIPAGSYLLARLLEKNEKWEKSYQYAAMAFQAGRVINDYWTMEQCRQAIARNKYYQNNRSGLKDWEKAGRELLPARFRELIDLDLRTALVNLIH